MKIRSFVTFLGLSLLFTTNLLATYPSDEDLIALSESQSQNTSKQRAVTIDKLAELEARLLNSPRLEGLSHQRLVRELNVINAMYNLACSENTVKVVSADNLKRFEDFCEAVSEEREYVAEFIRERYAASAFLMVRFRY